MIDLDDVETAALLGHDNDAACGFPMSAPRLGRSSSVDAAVLLPRIGNGTFKNVWVGSACGGSYSWRPSVRGCAMSDTSMIEMPENQQPAYSSSPQRTA